MGDHSAPGTRPMSALPVQSPRVAARVVNGEALILTPHDSVLHTLDPVATRVWELLPDHRTLESLVAALAMEYDASEATLQADLSELLAELAGKGIVVPGTTA